MRGRRQGCEPDGHFAAGGPRPEREHQRSLRILPLCASRDACESASGARAVQAALTFATAQPTLTRTERGDLVSDADWDFLAGANGLGTEY